jgi:microcystin-dependent protein
MKSLKSNYEDINMDYILGSVSIFPWNWQSEGWLKCDGRLLKIEDYQALYSLLGSEFGGDRKTTFAIPNIPAIKTAQGGDLDYYIAVQGIYPDRS